MCQQELNGCEDMVTHFSVDEDDDGFIDYAQLEQNNEVGKKECVDEANSIHAEIQRRLITRT